MGWFGGGGASKEEEHHQPSLMGGGGESSFTDDAAEFGADAGAALGSSSSLGTGGLSEFQEFSLALQQQILIQNVITDLSERAFTKCCGSASRENKLTGKEVACIHAATNKWLDCNELLMGRMAKKQQQAAGNQFG
jgi:hypothetical protein